MEGKEIIMLNRFNVMPVKDKKPLVAWTDLIDREQPLEDRLKIIKDNPAGNIGVVCGAVSKLFVLDDDGSEELKKYPLPRTATVDTPREVSTIISNGLLLSITKSPLAPEFLIKLILEDTEDMWYFTDGAFRQRLLHLLNRPNG